MIPILSSDIDAIGELDPDFGKGRPDRTHHVRHHVHRPAAHRAVKPSAQLAVGLVGRHPVVGRSRILFRVGVQMKVRSSVRATSFGLERCR